MGICIDRCICFDRSIDQLVQVARDNDACSLDDLSHHVDFGQKCGLCRPYVRRALETGQTTFHEVLTDLTPSDAEPRMEKLAG